jgi:hypothetical protein
MTINGNRVRCDGKGCAAAAVLPVRNPSDQELEQPLPVGWTMVVKVTHFCPNHPRPESHRGPIEMDEG